jgi:uncharacterized membrane protein
MWKDRLLSRGEIDRIEAKIAAAERLTSAELRVILTRSSWLGIKRKARRLFDKHGLHKTADRNAVLVLVDVRSREILIYGDEGIDQRVDNQFWDDVRDMMIEEFRQGRLADGLCIGIRTLGETLSQFFPPTGSDVNELENALIFD